MVKKILFTLMLFLMACNLFVIGCAMQRNAETGQWQWRVDPVAYEKVEKGTEAGINILEILTPFLGPVGGIATGTLATGLALLKKFKPQLTTYKNKAELSNAVATITVESIEEMKKLHPEAWADLKARVDKFIMDNNVPSEEIINAIRGLRGLPPKEGITL